jgi:hypothetical protein
LRELGFKDGRLTVMLPHTGHGYEPEFAPLDDDSGLLQLDDDRNNDVMPWSVHEDVSPATKTTQGSKGAPSTLSSPTQALKKAKDRSCSDLDPDRSPISYREI